MIEALPGLFGIGIVATVGFVMVRSFNARRRQGSDSSYDSGPSYGSSGGSTSSEGGSWFGGLFGSSESSSSSHDSGSSSDSGGGGGGGSD
jgi:hypothetical protein